MLNLGMCIININFKTCQKQMDYMFTHFLSESKILHVYFFMIFVEFQQPSRAQSLDEVPLEDGLKIMTLKNVILPTGVS